MFVASLPYAAWRAGFVGWLRSLTWCGGTLFPVHLAAFRTAELGVLIRQIRRHRHVLPLLNGVVRWFSDSLNFSGRIRYPRPAKKRDRYPYALRSARNGWISVPFFFALNCELSFALASLPPQMIQLSLPRLKATGAPKYAGRNRQDRKSPNARETCGIFLSADSGQSGP